MKIIEATSLNADQKAAIMDLWNREYPANLRYSSLAGFDDYLAHLANKEHLLLSTDSGKIAGWALLFDRDGEKWFAIILDAQLQGKGYGTRLLNIIKAHGVQLAGWVIDHDRDLKADDTSYRSPLGFYLKNDFLVHPQTRLELENISAVKIAWLPGSMHAERDA